MKKIIFYIVAIASLFFTACNPNKEVYIQLDSLKQPYTEAIKYTLTDDDYTTIKTLGLQNAQNAEDSAIAKDVGTFKSFSKDRPPYVLVAYFLDQEFIALDTGSSALITYNYSLEDKKIDKIDFSDTVFTDNDAIIDSLAATITDASNGDVYYVVYQTVDGMQDTVDAAGLFEYQSYYSNKFKKIDNSYVLTDEDYESMGAPGEHHNFSSSETPDFYVPIFLKQKFPYVSVGDRMYIGYKYYSGGTHTYYAVWEFDGQDWINKIEKSAQFVRYSQNWKFDPTVTYQMTDDDYQIIVDWVKNNDTLSGYMSQYPNTEYYFGASSHYGNFDMRVDKRRLYDPNGYLTGLSDDEALKAIWDRIPIAINILLEAKYPTAVPAINGVPVYYNIIFKTYEPERHKYTIQFLCTDIGKFQYVSGPDMVE